MDLYLHPPQDAVVISVDEKCPIQALDRIQDHGITRQKVAEALDSGS